MSIQAPISVANSPDRKDVVIGIIQRAGKVLICQRPGHGSFPHYWEFPGGKREAGETITECLEREIQEELAIRITPTLALTPLDHDYPAGRIRLHPFLCDHRAGEPELLACQDVRWVSPLELPNYQFPPANEQLVREAIAHLTDPRRDERVAADG